MPFQLNPHMNESVNKLQYYNLKFGPARVATIIPRMTQVFADLGIKYSIGGEVGNTFDSHRLIYYAGEKGKQNEIVEELFKNYFEEEKDISRPSVLLAAAEKVGLEGAKEVIDNPDAYKENVEYQLKLARGVSGVPYFIIDDAVKLSGGQPPEVFAEVFTDLLED